jgi:hypothetical protein
MNIGGGLSIVQSVGCVKQKKQNSIFFIFVLHFERNQNDSVSFSNIFSFKFK